MGFPVIASEIGSAELANTASHTVTMPAGLSPGDLIVVFFAGSAQTITFPAGWSGFSPSLDLNDGAVHVVGKWRRATGSEGASITVATSGIASPCLSIHWAARITGANAFLTPEAATAAFTGTTTPDPPAIAVSGGLRDYLFIAGAVYFDAAANNPPISWSSPGFFQDLFSSNGPQAGAESLHIEWQVLTVGAVDPGVIKAAIVASGIAFVMAIYPARMTALTSEPVRFAAAPFAARAWGGSGPWGATLPGVPSAFEELAAAAAVDTVYLIDMQPYIAAA